MHDDYRRFYYDFRVTSVARVPSEMSMRSIFGNKTSGSSEEG